jgi:hypothetical protein
MSKSIWLRGLAGLTFVIGALATAWRVSRDPALVGIVLTQ